MIEAPQVRPIVDRIYDGATMTPDDGKGWRMVEVKRVDTESRRDVARFIESALQAVPRSPAVGAAHPDGCTHPP